MVRILGVASCWLWYHRTLYSLRANQAVSLVIVIVDFHTHSLASDGALAPIELLRRAKAAGVQQFALTDHDTTAGYLAVRHPSEAEEIGLISGVELSCRWATTTIHVVGLVFDADAPEMLSLIHI